MKQAVALLMCLCVLTLSLPVYAKGSVTAPTEPFKIYTTAYMETGNLCASGCEPRYGIAAGKKEWMGMAAILYECKKDGSIGDYLGIYECLDTGFGGDADGDGIGSIQTGKVIDIFFEDLEGCKEWMKLTGGKVYVQLVDAVG